MFENRQLAVFEGKCRQFWAKIGQIGQNILVQNWPNFFFIMQSGYAELTLFYKKFSFIIETISSVK